LDENRVSANPIDPFTKRLPRMAIFLDCAEAFGAIQKMLLGGNA
jgi:hypothetical protein